MPNNDEKPKVDARVGAIKMAPMLPFDPEPTIVMPSVVSVPTFTDDRGVLYAVTNNLGPEMWKIVKRVYTVQNHHKGIVRGFHYHKKEWKIFITIKGAIKYVAIDPTNPSNKVTIVTTDTSPKVLKIPPLWANGWVSLTNDAILLALSTSTPEESKEDDWRINPYYWGDVWKTEHR